MKKNFLYKTTFRGAIHFSNQDGTVSANIAADFKIIDQFEEPVVRNEELIYEPSYLVAILICEFEQYAGTLQRIRCSEMVNCKEATK